MAGNSKSYVNAKNIAIAAELARRYGPAVAQQVGSLLNDSSRTRSADSRPAAPIYVQTPNEPADAPASDGQRPEVSANPVAQVADTARNAFGSVKDAAARRTADGKLGAKFDVLDDLIEKAQPGTPVYAQAQASRQRLEALRTKRSLVLRAYSGRERAKALKDVQAGVDELLREFLAANDQQLS